MTLFQGYAQRSSVSENTIKVEDPSQKILAEAQNTLQNGKHVLQMNKLQENSTSQH